VKKTQLVSVKKCALFERSEFAHFSEGSKFLAKFHGRSALLLLCEQAK
jgi:hypothetical protein